MKHFVFFLGIYLAVLAVYPCYDACCDEEELVTSVEEAHHDCSDATESCTPFCVNACCSVPSIVQTIEPKVSESPEFDARESAYVNMFLSAFDPSIWQPPKIG